MVIAMMKKLVLVLVALAAVAFGVSKSGLFLQEAPLVSISTESGDQQLARLYGEKRSSVQVQGSGMVTKVLPDDNDGNRHQRLIIELSTGQTLLIAHNVDIAPRIEGLERGDRVEFCGEYEWNRQGGVVHWTHKDSSGRHPDGWISRKGRKYW
jgi:hypothetical protein